MPDLPSFADDTPSVSDALTTDPNSLDKLPSDDVPSSIEEEFPSLNTEVETVVDEEEEIEEELVEASGEAPVAEDEETGGEHLCTRVGARQFPSLYPIDKCNATQLLASLERATISPKGPSRSPYPKPPPPSMDLSTFKFSFESELFTLKPLSKRQS